MHVRSKNDREKYKKEMYGAKYFAPYAGTE